MTDGTKRLIFVDVEFIGSLQAENANLREQLAEAVGLLQDLPDMMGGDNWGDFLTLDDERRVLGVIEAKNGLVPNDNH